MNSPSWLHQAVTWLLTPALLALIAACAIALAEAGLALGERLWGLRRLAATGDLLPSSASPGTAWSGPTCWPASRPCWA
jgi:hypothetical protein